MTELEIFEDGYNGLIKNIIVGVVEESTGIKATELITQFCRICREQNIDVPETGEYLRYVDELVNAGEIVELEYVLPATNYRIKSLYFPKGTALLTKGEEI